MSYPEKIEHSGDSRIPVSYGPLNTFLLLSTIILVLLLPVLSSAFLAAAYSLIFILCVSIVFVNPNLFPLRATTKVCLITCVVGYSLILTISSIANLSTPKPDRYAQLVLISFVFYSFTKYQWTSSNKRLCVIFLYAMLFAIWGSWFLTGMPTSEFAAFYNNSNIPGIAIFGILGLLLILSGDRMHNIVIPLLLTVPLIVFSSSRGAELALLIAAVFSIFKKIRVSQTKKTSAWPILGVFGLIALISTQYPKLYGTDLGWRISDLVRQYTGKNLFSGREDLWLLVIDQANSSKLIGIGPERTTSFLEILGYSAHNLYIQTFAECGYIGLVFLCSLLVILFLELSYRGGYVCVFGQAFLLGVMIHETFEVTLTQNGLPVGLLIWVALGSAFGQADPKASCESLLISA